MEQNVTIIKAILQNAYTSPKVIVMVKKKNLVYSILELKFKVCV